MKSAKEWNDSGSKARERDLEIQNEAIHVVRNEEYEKTGVLCENGVVADFQTRLQELYRQPEEPDKERNFMTLAKAWKSQVPGKMSLNKHYKIARYTWLKGVLRWLMSELPASWRTLIYMLDCKKITNMWNNLRWSGLILSWQKNEIQVWMSV